MPVGVLKNPSDERYWSDAKASVKRSYKESDKAYWPTVMKVFKQMKKKHSRAIKKMRKAPMPMYLHQGPY